MALYDVCIRFLETDSFPPYVDITLGSEWATFVNEFGDSLFFTEGQVITLKLYTDPTTRQARYVEDAEIIGPGGSLYAVPNSYSNRISIYMQTVKNKNNNLRCATVARAIIDPERMRHPAGTRVDDVFYDAYTDDGALLSDGTYTFKDVFDTFGGYGVWVTSMVAASSVLPRTLGYWPSEGVSFGGTIGLPTTSFYYHTASGGLNVGGESISGRGEWDMVADGGWTLTGNNQTNFITVNGYVTQFLGEIAVSPIPNMQLAQQAIEVIRQNVSIPEGSARVTQFLGEANISPIPNLRLAQQAIEVIRKAIDEGLSGTGGLTLGGTTTHYVVGAVPTARISQVVSEVVVTEATPEFRVSQAVMEVLVETSDFDVAFGRVSQVVSEVVAAESAPEFRVSQAIIEVLMTPNPRITAEGGLTIGGAAGIPQEEWFYTGNGGLVLGGTSSAGFAFSFIASGGLVLGGTSPAGFVFTFTASGGLTLGGAASVSVSGNYAYTASGGLILGGEAFVTASNFSYVASGSGGAITGGAAIAFSNQVFVASGGLVLGGTAVASLVQVFVASGGLVIGGSALTVTGQGYIGTGGLVIGGSVDAAISGYTAVGAGGLVLGGSASANASNAYVATGGLTISGEGADVNVHYIYIIPPALYRIIFGI